MKEVEQGYCICKDGHVLLKERHIDGQAHSIDIPVRCSKGKPHALIHSHPSGNLRPSRQDILTSKKTGLPVCVMVRSADGRKTRCYKAI